MNEKEPVKMSMPPHPARTLGKVVVYIYWILFIFIGSFVLLSLFIGAGGVAVLQY